MGYYDELDHEIDQEMGWSRARRKKNAQRASESEPPQRRSIWRLIGRAVRATRFFSRTMGTIARPVAKVLFFPLISPLGYAKRFNVEGDMLVIKRSVLWRVCDGILTRILLLPVILGIFLAAVVFATTHPKTAMAISTPDSMGIYFKRITLVSIDNQHLAAWYIPPLNADELTFDPEGSLLQRWPAAVVCHGLGASHDQYLGLARELHMAGFAVLMLDLRGQGESDATAVTYGLREGLDVLAGVKYLRETAYIDETKVCVVGHDIGATAALQAATLDSAIAAIVADGLWPRFEDRSREAFSRCPPDISGTGSSIEMPTQWLAPLYNMTFEIAVRARLSQLDPLAVVRNIHTQPVLFVARTGSAYASLGDVRTLATSAGSRHEVFVDDPRVEGDSEQATKEFLVKATGWKGPNARGNEQIQSLLKNEVKP